MNQIKELTAKTQKSKITNTKSQLTNKFQYQITKKALINI